MKIPGILCIIFPVLCQLFLLYILQPARHPKARGRIYLLLALWCVGGSFGLGALFGNAVAVVVQPPICYLLVFAAALWVDAYRGWRFLFTYLCTLVLSGFCGGLAAMAGLKLGQPWAAVGLCAAACLALALLAARFWVADAYRNEQRMGAAGWRLLALAPSFACAIMYLIAYYPTPMIQRPGDYLVTASAILTLILCLIVVVLELNRHTAEMIQAARVEEQAKLQLQRMENQYDSMRESQKQLHLLRHDMLHHIRQAAGLLAEGRIEDAADYLGKIDGMVVAVDLKQYCRSRTGNITLTWYAREAARLGISFECQADIPPERPECSADLCAVLANALQNALEGSQTAAKPAISVTDAPAGRALLLSVENSFDGALRCEGGAIASRKRDEGHGLGLASIRMLAPKPQHQKGRERNGTETRNRTERFIAEKGQSAA